MISNYKDVISYMVASFDNTLTCPPKTGLNVMLGIMNGGMSLRVGCVYVSLFYNTGGNSSICYNRQGLR
jgi:hypothetical protein